MIKYFLLVFPAASAGLGVWQLQRLEWKKALIKRLEDQLREEPLELSQINQDNIDRFEYRRFKTKGRFDRDPDAQILLKPVQLNVNEEAIRRGRSAHQPVSGVNVITPFNVDDTKQRILVNRGWLALKGKDSVENSLQLGLGPENQSIELTGILRTSDKRPRYGLVNNELSNEWNTRDVAQLARRLKTLPIYIDADESLSRDIGPIGGQTRLAVRNEHLNYAITWFGLSICILLMWRVKYKNKKAIRRVTQ